MDKRKLLSIKFREFLDYLKNYKLLKQKKNVLHGVSSLNAEGLRSLSNMAA
jgi:hypothetical protein